MEEVVAKLLHPSELHHIYEQELPLKRTQQKQKPNSCSEPQLHHHSCLCGENQSVSQSTSLCLQYWNHLKLELSGKRLCSIFLQTTQFSQSWERLTWNQNWVKVRDNCGLRQFNWTSFSFTTFCQYSQETSSGPLQGWILLAIIWWWEWNFLVRESRTALNEAGNWFGLVASDRRLCCQYCCGTSWLLTNFKPAAMFCLDSRIFPPINSVLINVSISRFCKSTLEDSSSPHWSLSALSHLYRMTRLRQRSSRADRLSYPGHRNIRAFRDTSGTAFDGRSSESLSESNSHLALPNTSNLLTWIRLQVGWLMAPTSSWRSP